MLMVCDEVGWDGEQEGSVRELPDTMRILLETKRQGLSGRCTTEIMGQRVERDSESPNELGAWTFGPARHPPPPSPDAIGTHLRNRLGEVLKQWRDVGSRSVGV